MHAGVIRDMEQQRLKRERQLDFEMQRALEEEYRKLQHVSDGGGREEKKLWRRISWAGTKVPYTLYLYWMSGNLYYRRNALGGV